MEDVCIFDGQLVYFMVNLVYLLAIWYIKWLFGIFFPVLVYCTKKNMATLVACNMYTVKFMIRLILTFFLV
jgi:hypothetical protein